MAGWLGEKVGRLNPMRYLELAAASMLGGTTDPRATLGLPESASAVDVLQEAILSRAKLMVAMYGDPQLLDKLQRQCKDEAETRVAVRMLNAQLRTLAQLANQDVGEEGVSGDGGSCPVLAKLDDDALRIVATKLKEYSSLLPTLNQKIVQPLVEQAKQSVIAAATDAVNKVVAKATSDEVLQALKVRTEEAMEFARAKAQQQYEAQVEPVVRWFRRAVVAILALAVLFYALVLSRRIKFSTTRI